MSATTAAVNGLALLKVLNYDDRLAAAVIAIRDDWQALLDSIPSPNLRRNVAALTWQVRESLGLEAEYAKQLAE